MMLLMLGVCFGFGWLWSLFCLFRLRVFDSVLLGDFGLMICSFQGPLVKACILVLRHCWLLSGYDRPSTCRGVLVLTKTLGCFLVLWPARDLYYIVNFCVWCYQG